MPRQPEYDREAVISHATAVFWERGYTRTSVTDLVDATGLKPGSLYAAFGNKKGLFLEVVDCYNTDFVNKLKDLRDADGPVTVRIRAMLDGMIDDTVDGGDHRGCLSVNALLEMSQHDAEIAASLDRHADRIRRAFMDLIKDAQAAGEISADRDAGALAGFVMNNVWGMRVLCRGNPSRRSLAAIVDGVMLALEA